MVIKKLDIVSEANTTTLPKECNGNTEVCEAIRPIVNPSVNTANNRLNGYDFDDSGNTTVDAQGRIFIYDAENKQIEVQDDKEEIIGQYRYDGDGKRVKKIVPATGEATIFVYDASGKSIAEYSTQVEPIETAKVAYLTADHLGSPRINTDRDANITSRRDFHPFGEEIGVDAAMPTLPNGQPARTAALGYGEQDHIRQKFTGYERDNESSLDYTKARMYGNSYERFTSPDPLLSSATPDDPQTWHRYAYALNNPLFYTDPTGMYVCKGNKEQCEQFTTRLAEAKTNLAKIEKTYGKDSKEYKKAAASVNSYGEDETGKKKNNGVIVVFDLKKSGGETTANFANNGKGKLVGDVTVHFNKDALDSDSSQALVAHEGSHIDDYKTVGQRSNLNEEFDAHKVQSLFLEAQFPEGTRNFTAKDGTKYPIWNPSWEGPDKETLRSNAIKDWLAVPDGYNLKPPKPKAPKATPKRRKS